MWLIFWLNKKSVWNWWKDPSVVAYPTEKVIIHCFSIKLEFTCERVLGFLEEGKLKKKTWMINVHACLAKFLLTTTVFYSYFLQLFLFKINWIIILFCSMNYTSGLSVWCTNFQRYVSKLISKMCWWKWYFL